MYYDNNPKVNFQEKDLFQYRFKREPREWSLEDIHDLWIRSIQRSEERRKISSSIYDKIIKEIPKNDKGEKLVYFTEDGKVYKYSFRYSTEFNTYGYSRGSVEFSKDKVNARNEKIEFILSNKRAFELGQEYREAKKFDTQLHLRVKRIFIDIIERKLQKIYKDKLVPDITVVDISGRKYYFAVDDQHRYSYKKFHFRGEVNDPIKL